MAEKPRMPIRRFDVFADYNRVRNEGHGMPEDIAKGRALWVAKVVAGRRYGAHPGEVREGRAEREQPAPAEEGYRSIGGKEQTGAISIARSSIAWALISTTTSSTRQSRMRYGRTGATRISAIPSAATGNRPTRHGGAR